MKVLITGASGFTGRSLYNLLSKDPKNELYLASRKRQPCERFCICDLTDYRSVNRLISEIVPNQIYNLAGSFSNNYNHDYNANVLIAKNILDSVLDLDIKAKILLIGSAAEYGIISPEDNPVSEKHLLKPVSVYGMTKAFQTHLFYYYSIVHNMDIVMARPFNLYGRDMSNKLLIGTVYDQIRKLKKGEITRINVGRLSSKRDYINVDAAVKYYRLIMNYGQRGEIYNVGSGRSRRMSDLIDAILRAFKLPKEVLKINNDGDSRRFDVEDIYADIGKLRELQKSVA